MAHFACFCAWTIAASSTAETDTAAGGGIEGLATGAGATAGVGFWTGANVGAAAGGGTDR